LRLKKFFTCSIILHALILYGISLIPAPEKRQPSAFFAKLISPEEAIIQEAEPRQRKIIPKVIPPRMPEKPVFPQTALKERHIPEKPLLPRIVPKTRPVPSDEKPVVPGEGREKGRPLPEGVYPRDDGEKGTEGAPDTEKYEEPGFLEKGNIFDSNVIGDIAKSDPGKAGRRKGKDRSITFDTDEYRYLGYMRKLKERIESIWRYPPEAKKRGIYADLRIRFTIKKNGLLGRVQLIRTSGYKMLDDAALQALKDGEPYWPLPDEWDMESYTIMGHFIYSPYGYYVR
jgi:protein TonB